MSENVTAPQPAPAAADARGVVVDFPGMWTTHPMTRDGAVALMGQFWHAVEGATIHYLPGEQPTAEEIAKSEEAGRIAKAIEQHVIAMLSMPFAPAAPAAPAAADAREGERVSVDAQAFATVRDMFSGGWCMKRNGEPCGESDCGQCDFDKWVDELIATARPLPTAAAVPVARELLPCPFCGIAQATFLEGDGDWSPGAVMCVECGADGPSRQHEADAVAAWNRRPLATAAPLPPAPAVPVGVDRAEALAKAVRVARIHLAQAYLPAGCVIAAMDLLRDAIDAYDGDVPVSPFADAPADAQAVEA